MAKKWMQTEAGRKAQAKRMKAVWAARRAAQQAKSAELEPIQKGSSDQHYSVYLTTYRADKLLEVLRAVKASRLEIHILD